MSTKTLIAFGDVHIPYHHPAALKVLTRAVEIFRPNILICLGDLLDCSQFKGYPPTWGVQETEYEEDLEVACKLLDHLQQFCEKLILIEGNHEYRLDRWAASTSEGRGAYSLLAPRYRLTNNRKCIYVPYGSANGKYPYYSVNTRLVAVHGWTYAKNAARQHLSMSQGKSVIFGHTHRAESSIIQDIWSPSRVIEARGAGCLCKLIPLYGTGCPVEWVHAFIIGFLGKHSDTLYTVPIMNNKCILPDGTKVSYAS